MRLLVCPASTISLGRAASRSNVTERQMSLVASRSTFARHEHVFAGFSAGSSLNWESWSEG
jgi:hypothetical protein